MGIPPMDHRGGVTVVVLVVDALFISNAGISSQTFTLKTRLVEFAVSACFKGSTINTDEMFSATRIPVRLSVWK